MGCPCEIRVYAARKTIAKQAIDAAIAEIDRLDRKYTLYRDDSLLAQINSSAGSGQQISVDEETAGLLDYADQEYQFSEGLFDITLGALWRVWDFHSGRLPDPTAISAALNVTGWHKVSWRRPDLCLPIDGSALDLGGIVKEYAADRGVVMLRQHQIEHGLVDLGGDLSVLGPRPDGSGWSTGIRNPASPNQAIAVIDLQSGGLATSGDYERCLEIDGLRYGHIINPTTGWPVQGHASISVQASSCLAAGAISTVAMLKGKIDGLSFLQDTGLAFLTVDHQGQVESSQMKSAKPDQANIEMPSADRFAG